MPDERAITPHAAVVAAQIDNESDAATALQCADAFGALLAAIDEARVAHRPLSGGRRIDTWPTNPPPRQAEVR